MKNYINKKMKEWKTEDELLNPTSDWKMIHDGNLYIDKNGLYTDKNIYVYQFDNYIEYEIWLKNLNIIK